MSARDRKYTPGGSDHADGNYEVDHTIASRAGRLYMMERGKWIGGRGRVLGSRLHEIQKADEDTPAEARRMIEEAFEPLLSSGEMTDLSVASESIVGREDALGNTVIWTDTTMGDSVARERTSGRKG